MPDNTITIDHSSKAAKKVRPQSQLKEVFKRLVQNKLALIGMVLLAVYILIAIFGPLMTSYNYAEFSFDSNIGEELKVSFDLSDIYIKNTI